jgi:hypothetical protein
MAETKVRKDLENFYDTVQTAAGLVGNLALNIAEAQRRLDGNYIENLAAFSAIIREQASSEKVKDLRKEKEEAEKDWKAETDAEKKKDLEKALATASEALEKAEAEAGAFLTLFKAIAPSRYQFTETIVEVRADLQMGSMKQFDVGGTFGLNAGVFAVAVNASYTKRSAYDFRASALIRSTLHAVSADPDVMAALLAHEGPELGDLLAADRYKGLAEAFGELPQLPAPKATP